MQEIFWATTLSKDHKEYVWMPGSEQEKKRRDIEQLDFFFNYSLKINQVFLGKEADLNGTTIVELETSQEKLKMPLVILRGQNDHYRTLDTVFTFTPTKLVLLEGDGPVHFIGVQRREQYTASEDGEDEMSVEDEDNEEEEEEEDEDEEEKTPAPVNRKLSASKTVTNIKKATPVRAKVAAATIAKGKKRRKIEEESEDDMDNEEEEEFLQNKRKITKTSGKKTPVKQAPPKAKKTKAN